MWRLNLACWSTERCILIARDPSPITVYRRVNRNLVLRPRSFASSSRFFSIQDTSIVKPAYIGCCLKWVRLDWMQYLCTSYRLCSQFILIAERPLLLYLFSPMICQESFMMGLSPCKSNYQPTISSNLFLYLSSLMISQESFMTGSPHVEAVSLATTASRKLHRWMSTKVPPDSARCCYPLRRPHPSRRATPNPTSIPLRFTGTLTHLHLISFFRLLRPNRERPPDDSYDRLTSLSTLSPKFVDYETCILIYSTIMCKLCFFSRRKCNSCTDWYSLQ